MTTMDDYRAVAQQVLDEMNQKRFAFMTKYKADFTAMLRQVSGRRGAKIGSTVANEMESALASVGLKVFPHLADVGPAEPVRILRAGTTISDILDSFLYPGTRSDEQLAQLISKVKSPAMVLLVEGGE